MYYTYFNCFVKKWANLWMIAVQKIVILSYSFIWIILNRNIYKRLKWWLLWVIFETLPFIRDVLTSSSNFFTMSVLPSIIASLTCLEASSSIVWSNLSSIFDSSKRMSAQAGRHVNNTLVDRFEFGKLKQKISQPQRAISVLHSYTSHERKSLFIR